MRQIVFQVHNLRQKEHVFMILEMEGHAHSQHDNPARALVHQHSIKISYAQTQHWEQTVQ